MDSKQQVSMRAPHHPIERMRTKSLKDAEAEAPRTEPFVKKKPQTLAQMDIGAAVTAGTRF